MVSWYGLSPGGDSCKVTLIALNNLHHEGAAVQGLQKISETSECLDEAMAPIDFIQYLSTLIRSMKGHFVCLLLGFS